MFSLFVNSLLNFFVNNTVNCFVAASNVGHATSAKASQDNNHQATFVHTFVSETVVFVEPLNKSYIHIYN